LHKTQAAEPIFAAFKKRTADGVSAVLIFDKQHRHICVQAVVRIVAPRPGNFGFIAADFQTLMSYRTGKWLEDSR